MLPSYKYSMVYNKDPIDKEKAIKKTYVHLQGSTKKWYQVMLLVSLRYLMTSYLVQETIIKQCTSKI